MRLVDAIPVSVKGNPVYPVNKGGLCPLGLNALHSFYHPDRIKGPLKRTGPVGAGRWESTGWDEALKTIKVTPASIDLREGIIYYRFKPGEEEKAWKTFDIAKKILEDAGFNNVQLKIDDQRLGKKISCAFVATNPIEGSVQ